MIGMQRCGGILRLFGRVDGRLISLLLLTITVYKRFPQDGHPLPKRRWLNPTATSRQIRLASATLTPKTVSAIRLTFHSRYSAPMCTVCSRTCNARAALPTSPATPSPRRPVLAVKAPNTNATKVTVVKRKKHLCDNDDERDVEGGLGEDAGCGRTVPRLLL
ncbi:hypothetical protein K438DRAFT_1989117 [Mycena galopus ATCC 62051]|nr:hypothetical protein K438DRAFT_1783554 [Mycena galopus ATCC 62051]KAF8148756.1 hypothetical protein K438DRAFT_1989117 [Mycena galopus ATCC 62051]